jgi:uncharacterized protein YaiL (DUF2058 family)
LQNLRDKLLKAGLVDKKAKKKADHRTRKKRTRAKRAGVDPNAERAEKDLTAEKKFEAKREADRERSRANKLEQQAAEASLAAERKNRERAEREEQRRLQTIYQAREMIQASMFLPPKEGPVRFHFVSRSGGIRHLQLPTPVAQELDRGQLAIAELPGFQRWGLVPRDVAEQVLGIEPALIRFFTADAEGDLTTAPEAVSQQASESKLRANGGLETKGAKPNRRREG